MLTEPAALSLVACDQPFSEYCLMRCWSHCRRALCRDCKAFLPPTLTPEQEEEAKPKKIKQVKR